MNFANINRYALLVHVQSALFLDTKEYQYFTATDLTIDRGIFSRGNTVKQPLSNATSDSIPSVTIVQNTDGIVVSCTCAHDGNKLCEHAAQALFCVMESTLYRPFFDHVTRHRLMLPSAKKYGLDQESNLDAFFSLTWETGQIIISPSIKELLPIDYPLFKQTLLAPKEERQASSTPQSILVIGRHRYYNQLYCQVMSAERTQNGTLKNPINPLDVSTHIWKSNNHQEVKFFTAIATLQNQYGETDEEMDYNLLRSLVANPLQLEVYHHNRNISEKITARTLVPIKLIDANAYIKLSVFQKEPFYEVTGELVLADEHFSFTEVAIRYGCFIFYNDTFHLLPNAAVLRVIKFFKSNHEKLLIHPSKYEEFSTNILAPLEHYVQVHYSYIIAATTAAEKTREQTAPQPIIYLEQEGNFIGITPVMKYSRLEVPVYSRKELYQTDANGNTVHVARHLDAEAKLLKTVLKQHPDFEEQRKEITYFYLHKDKFFEDDWFLNAFEDWQHEGITILGFDSIENNNLNPNRAKIDIQILSGEDWFNADLRVKFGKQKASMRQLMKAIRHKRKFVELGDGSHGMLPDEWLQKIEQYFRIFEVDKELFKIPKIGFSDLATLFEKDVFLNEARNELTLLQKDFSKAKKRPNVPTPLGLKATLRTYQQEGLNWLAFLDNRNFGGCLADDMGLGKTLQIIAFILYLRERNGARTHLIVVPTSLLFNWQEEIRKFAPDLKSLTYHGEKRNKNLLSGKEHDVILTSYGTILSDIDHWKKASFDYIFVDESQAIKNPNAERYKALRLLDARNRIVMTGTPIENNTFDIYGQMSFCCPGLLGSKLYFKNTYAIPIDRFGDNKRAKELFEKIAPFVLRRTKKQVAKELPEKTEIVLYCEMEEQQRALYNELEEELRSFVAERDEQEVREQRIHVLAGLTKLRQICNSPRLLKEGHTGEHAAKVEVLLSEIENKVTEHKILIFSQFVEMLDIIKEALQTRNIGFEYLTGQSNDRGTKVNNFKSNDAVRVFLISLKAGGVGLNLTEADYVYLVDPWWNPAVENQAIDRVHRIGQNKPVMAIRLICQDSIEEKMMRLQQRKRMLAQDLIKSDKTAQNDLSKEDLLTLLGK